MMIGEHCLSWRRIEVTVGVTHLVSRRDDSESRAHSSARLSIHRCLHRRHSH